MQSTLIKGGMVYKGDNVEYPEKYDIVIKKNKIIKITQNLSNKNLKKTDKIIDATGSIITPGFIEINESITSPFSLLREKSGVEYIKSGITSVIFGADGISPMPLYYGSRKFLKNLLSSVYSPINVSWENTKEIYSTLENLSGVNFGFFLGYTTLRSIFSYKREGDLTIGEIENLSRIITKELKDGALGIAFNFNEPYLENISWDEIVRVINFSGIKNKVLNFNINKEEKILDFLEKILSFAHNKQFNIEINNIQPLSGKSEIYLKFLEKIEEISDNYNINFDIFPEKISNIKLRSIFIKELLDKKQENFSQIKKFLQENPHLFYRDEIKKIKKFSPNEIIISEMPKPLKFLEGKKLEEFMEKHKISSIEEALLKISIISGFNAKICLPSGDESLLELFINSKNSILTTSPDNYKNSSKTFFEKILSSGKLIHKLTELPAKKLGLIGRGTIKEGNFADLVIFKDNLPYYVFVNGVAVLEEGIVKDIISWGNILKTKFEM